MCLSIIFVLLAHLLLSTPAESNPLYEPHQAQVLRSFPKVLRDSSGVVSNGPVVTESINNAVQTTRNEQGEQVTENNCSEGSQKNAPGINPGSNGKEDYQKLQGLTGPFQENGNHGKDVQNQPRGCTGAPKKQIATTQRTPNDGVDSHPTTTTVAKPKTTKIVAKPITTKSDTQLKTTKIVPKPKTTTTVAKPATIKSVHQPKTTKIVPKPTTTTTVAKPATTKSVPQPKTTKIVAKPITTKSDTQPKTTKIVPKPTTTTTVAKPATTKGVPQPKTTKIVAKPTTTESVAKPTATEGL